MGSKPEDIFSIVEQLYYLSFRGSIINSPEDELIRLAMRIVLLKSKIRSQIEALDQRASINKNASEPPQLQDNPDMLKNLFEIMTKDKEKPPTILKFLRVDYDDKWRWLSPNPLSSEKEKWITTPSVKRHPDPLKICTDCKYKEGLEEVLNILSVCGFIKKPRKGELSQDSPAVLKEPLMEQESHKWGA